MKKILFGILLCSSALVVTGCREDSFSPKGEYKEKYVLTCILRSDTTVQTAILSRSYNVPGYDPLENRTDPAIENADIRLWVGDSVYVMKGGEVPRGDTSRYNSPLKYYYASNVKLYSFRETEILAVLPNGRKLHARTIVPKPVSLDISGTEEIIPPSGRDYVVASWLPNSDPRTFYYPSFSISYFRLENGIPVRYVKKLPVKYVLSGGKYVPVYASPTNESACIIEMDAIRRTLQEISAGDPEKRNYVILSVTAAIMTMDENLSAYYSASKILDNGYSVKLDQTDFTNIEGGLGIFASFANTRFSIRLDKDYIKSFGYKTRLGDE
ncbi:MAG: DUF4249 family protein [Ignavibacteria bacterium]|jgi:hypothetical protein|nr:DUF4249 family protein [Ignavibacteria bacterium]MCU7501862.1 DUF4249 family protein [Ignavibacteria bacterium]MCU7514792.1 DUF4249 family protein [Ignavibacteria bacterium]